MQVIRYPREQFLADYRELRRRGIESGMILPAGLSCTSEGASLLVCGRASPATARRRLWMQLTNDVANRAPSMPSGIDGALILSHGTRLGCARGFLRVDGRALEPVVELQLVGPGMERIHLFGKEKQTRSHNGPLDFSRVQGALAGAWPRFSSLCIAIVGAGRLGGSIATVLAHDGVRRFVLIDPDSMESHNVAGSLAARAADIGRRKVDALADSLRDVNPAADVIRIPASVTHWRAAELISEADLIVCATDHDGGRLATACLAALHHKPLLDAGTGVFRDGVREEIGADVRLVWPGRCLLCAGRVGNEAESFHVLSSAEAEAALHRSTRDWHSERAGSLASLNAVAAGAAARMIEDFVHGALTENGSWSRLEFRDGSILATKVQTATARSSPCLCAFAGLGDDGRLALLQWIRRRIPTLRLAENK